MLCAQFGEDVPYVGDLDRGFAFRGQRVPFLNRQQGIFRAAAQGCPAALSIQTSVNGPYDDRETPDGVLYAYRGTDPSHRDHRAMRAAFELGTVGIDADYTVRISPRLLDEEDGPMLDLLKGFHAQPISVSQAIALRPDRERLAERFDRFLARA